MNFKKNARNRLINQELFSHMKNVDYFQTSNVVSTQPKSNFLNYLPKLNTSKITGKELSSQSFKHSLLALRDNSLDILLEINENKDILTLKERKIFDNALGKLHKQILINKVILPKVKPKSTNKKIVIIDSIEKVKKGALSNFTEDSAKIKSDKKIRSKLIDEFKVKVFDREGYPEIDNYIKKSKIERIFDQTCQMRLLIKEENDENDPDYVYKDDILNVRDYLVRKDKLVNKTLKDMIPGCVRRSIKFDNMKN